MPFRTAPGATIIPRILFDWNVDNTYEDTVDAPQILALEWERGKSESQAYFGASAIPRARIALENQNGRWTPWNTGSPLYPNVRPGANVDIRVSVNGGTYTTVFFGKVSRISPEFSKPARVVIECEGRMGQLARVYPSLGSFTGKVSDAVSAISSNTGIPITVSPSNVGVIAYPIDPDRSALEHIRELTWLEDGYFFETAAGTLFWYSRLRDWDNTSPITIDENVNTAEIVPNSLQITGDALATRSSFQGISSMRIERQTLFEFKGLLVMAPLDEKFFTFTISNPFASPAVVTIFWDDISGASLVPWSYTFLDSKTIRLRLFTPGTTVVIRRFSFTALVLVREQGQDRITNSSEESRIGVRDVGFGNEYVSFPTARARAQFIANSYTQSFGVLKATFQLNASATMANTLLTLPETTNAIVTSATFNLLNELYRVVGLRYSMTDKADALCEMVLVRKLSQTQYWTLNSSALGSTTRLWY
jgi:hypothetical protein